MSPGDRHYPTSKTGLGARLNPFRSCTTERISMFNKYLENQLFLRWDNARQSVSAQWICLSPGTAAHEPVDQ